LLPRPSSLVLKRWSSQKVCLTPMFWRTSAIGGRSLEYWNGDMTKGQDRPRNGQRFSWGSSAYLMPAKTAQFVMTLKVL